MDILVIFLLNSNNNGINASNVRTDRINAIPRVSTIRAKRIVSFCILCVAHSICLNLNQFLV